VWLRRLSSLIGPRSYLDEALSGEEIKVHDKVAVVGGDPFCEPDRFDSIFSEFAAYHKTFGWSIAFLGATYVFASYSRGNRWPTMQFGIERVLNDVARIRRP
jgi:hypothetical protein